MAGILAWPASARLRPLARRLRRHQSGASVARERKGGMAMKAMANLRVVLPTVGLLVAGPGWAADDSKVTQGAKQVESGAKRVGEAVVETAKGIGKTVVGGAELATEKIKEAGEAAKPTAKTAWGSVREGAVSFAQSVKTFFARLFGGMPEKDNVARETAGS